MKFQKLALGFFVGILVYVVAFVLLEIYFYHSTDAISTIVSRHWKMAIGISLLATIIQYVLYNVLGVKDPERR
ncbi:MAG TPA: hypothetical protein PLM41_21390 [Saprospiraceae bacterium]|nr:hypothetical protein [Saprospiraceae bacterium]